MKTLLTLTLSLGLAFAACGQTNFANVTSGTIAASLPMTISASNQFTLGPSSNMLWAAGWRMVNYVQQPANGWAVDTYTVSDTTNGFCSLLIGSQHNIQIAQDAVWTNSASWLTISNEAHTYSNLTWCYSPAHYTASLTNFVNTPQFIVSFYTSWVKTNATATVSNSVDFLNASWILADLINFAGSSTNFPWRLCP